MRQARKLWPYFLAIVVVAAAVVYFAISFGVAQTVTQVERLPLDPPASSIAATHEDVTFDSRDGIVLKGWWFAVDGADRAVVLVHGRGRNRVNSDFMEAAIARLLLVHGYSVLLFDLRGHGESGGTRYTLGIEEPRDILAAIDLAASKADIERSRVAIIGESLGGGSLLMTLKADPSIGPVVTDSAFADANTVVSESATKYTNLPSWFTPGIVLMSRLFLGLDISQVTPSKVVAAHPERAFLFIQCTDDTTVPLHHGLDLKAASRNPRTELWVVPGCEHVKAYATHPDEWAQHVLDFLGRELGTEKPVTVPAGILATPRRGG
ncbi:MAG: alpha/beta hydrolase [Chloroflexota bacterium]